MKFPLRACIGIQIFMACFVVYMLRVCLAVSIMAMVTSKKAGKNSTSECIKVAETSGNTSATQAPLPDYGPRYDWSRSDQGALLGAYFFGYLITCIPGGYLSDRFGAMIVTLISTICAGVLTIVIPLASKAHVWLVIIIRAFTGLTSGVVYPALQTLIARWAPPAEKGKFVAALMGNTLGTVVTYPLAGGIIETMGWVWTFIIFGAVALIWSVIWFFTVADTPADHRCISQEERDFIADSMSGAVKKVKKNSPLCKILRNIPFWAMAVAHFGNLWGLYLLLNNGPMYMKEVHGFDLKSSGALAALPHLARLIFGMIFGSVGDYIKKRKLMSTVLIRKVFTIFSHIIPGLLMLSVLLAGCNAPFAITAIMLSLGSNGAATITNLQNCQDLSPQFAGTLFGIANCIGSITGVVTPYLTSVFTKERSSVPEWNMVYGIGGCVYIGTAIVFILLGSGSIQSFNYVDEEPPTEAATQQAA